MKETLRFLYGSVPISFHSPLPLEEAVARLRSATIDSIILYSRSKPIYGSISKRRVSLHKITIGNRSMKPFFMGKFKRINGTTVLQGSFSVPWFQKIFITLWFGLVVTLVTKTEAITDPKALIVLLMLGAGLVALQLDKSLASNDQALISKVIKDALKCEDIDSAEHKEVTIAPEQNL